MVVCSLNHPLLHLFTGKAVLFRGGKTYKNKHLEKSNEDFFQHIVGEKKKKSFPAILCRLTWIDGETLSTLTKHGCPKLIYFTFTKGRE